MEDSMEIIKQFNEFSRRVQDKFGTQKIRIDEDKRFLSGEQYDSGDDSLISPQRVRQTVNIISNTVNSVVNAYSEYPYSWYTGDNELDRVADEFLKKSANSRATDDALLNSVSFGTAYMVMGTELQQGVSVPTLYSVPNPNDVLFDPDSTAIDGSDATEAAIVELKSINWIKQKYGEEWAHGSRTEAADISMDYDSNHLPLITYYVLKDGQVHVYKILCSGMPEDEQILAIDRLPIVPVYGEKTYSQNRPIYQGLVRKSKSIQKLTNLAFTQLAERLALSPKNIFISSDEAIEGYEDYYRDFHKTANPNLIYNAHNENSETVDKPTVMNNQVAFGDVTGIIESNLKLMQNVTGVEAGGLPDNKTEITATEALLNAKSFANNVRHYYKNLKDSFKNIGDVFFKMLGVEDAEVSVMQGPDELMQKQQARQELQTLIPLMDDSTKQKAVNAILMTFNENAYINDLYSSINGTPVPTKREGQLEDLAKQMHDAIAKKDAEILQLTQQNQQLQATVADTDKSARLSMLLEQEKTRREIYLKQMELAGDDKARQSELQKAYMEQEAEDQREAARIDAEMQKAAVKAQADVSRAHAASDDRVKEKLADNTTVNIDATGV